MSSEVWRLVLTVAAACGVTAAFAGVVLQPSVRRGTSRRRVVAAAVIVGIISVAGILIATLGTMGTVDQAVFGACAVATAMIIGVVLATLGRMTSGLAIAMSLCLPIASLLALMMFGRISGGIRTYVVPTGAMAPAIMGVHEALPCTACNHIIRIGAGTMPQDMVECYHCGNSVTIAPGTTTQQPGDRLFTATFRTPRRWDVITFINPQHPNEMYVKRLVGLPGETVLILDGDVFINGHREVKQPGEQESMWVLVHDTGLLRAPQRPDSPGWHPQEGLPVINAGDKSLSQGWRWEEGKWLGYSSADAAQELSFDGRITASGPYVTMRGSSSVEAAHDIRLRCGVEDLSADGALALRWRCRGVEVNASFHCGGTVELSGGLGPAPAKVQLPGSITKSEVGLIVRDGLAHALLDGAVVATIETLPTDLKPALDWVESGEGDTHVSINMSHGSVILGRVLLERDVHYTGGLESPHAVDGPIELSPQEFFGLGDNSVSSADSRFYGGVPVENYQQIVIGRYAPQERVGAWW